MDDFLAMLAHELRNPLAALCQGLALLRMPQAPEEDLDRTLDSLERQLAYALRIVADLYDASRIKRGRMELRQGPVCVQQLIGAVLDDMEKAVAQKQHRVEVRVAPEITVHGDWARLSQAFKNLVANAISYTEPGGDISIAAHERQDEVECRVRDSGRGIPPEMLPYLFETNYHQSSAPSSSGLGIGLGIVRRIVELHGGTVTAHSDGPGRGAEFVVRLPRWSIGE
jgi:signal transduction histidine kinase